MCPRHITWELCSQVNEPFFNLRRAPMGLVVRVLFGAHASVWPSEPDSSGGRIVAYSWYSLDPCPGFRQTLAEQVRATAPLSNASGSKTECRLWSSCANAA